MGDSFVPRFSAGPILRVGGRCLASHDIDAQGEEGDPPPRENCRDAEEPVDHGAMGTARLAQVPDHYVGDDDPDEGNRR